jgi:hypothetical protein
MSGLGSSSFNGIIVRVAQSRAAMGTQAAAAIGDEIRACLRKQAGVRIMFTAAPGAARRCASSR